MPTTPQYAAGSRTEPPVSVPRLPSASPAATATAEPPDEPPGTRARSHGLRALPYAEFSLDEPIANSSQFVLPTITAPAALSRAVTVASYGGTKSASMRDAAVVRMPAVAITSLTAT